MRKGSRAAQPRELYPIHIFSLIFTAIFLLHSPLLRLPYFWDEAGYYIPAAYDLFTRHLLIPSSIPSNGHPPLPAIYLAVWWKLSAFKPAVTRIAMLLVAAFGLTAVFRLGRMLSKTGVAIATLLCTALFPVWFAQSSLAHADLPAAALTLWGLFFYFRYRGMGVAEPRSSTASPNRHPRGDLFAAATCFALAGLCKETAIVFPFTLAFYDLVAMLEGKDHRDLLRPLLCLLSAAPLAGWFAYHHHVTGFYFGNPAFFTYNVTSTLTPLRVVLSICIRIWQIFGYMNLWLLTLATIWVMQYPPVPEQGSTRPRIEVQIQFRIGVLIAANIVLFSMLGGADLARYLLPVYPLVILIGISTLHRRLREWTWAVAVVIAGFVVALFYAPFGYVPPEDNLSYRNYILLHKAAANYLQEHDAQERILTAWPAVDELSKPFLGYVRQPIMVTSIDNFSFSQLELARAAVGQYDLALIFSTKQEPRASLLDRWPWWERMSRRYFGFHRDLPPEAAAQVLGGRVTWQRRRGQQWVAIVSFNRVENAQYVRGSGFSGAQTHRPLRTVPTCRLQLPSAIGRPASQLRQMRSSLRVCRNTVLHAPA
jgi:4-amino-4-deoxy-L-arabinose transferase-like glycosyltransferase